jgi:hypothetical protein
MPFIPPSMRPNHAQYEAIGRVAANWSVVEFALETILARLACAPDYPALALTNDLSMDNRLTAMRNLVEIHRINYSNALIAEEWLAALDTIRPEISKAKDRRNKVIHLVWMRVDDKTIFGTKFKGKPAGNALREPYQLRATVDELREFAANLDDLADRLFALAEHLPEIDETSLRTRS